MKSHRANIDYVQKINTVILKLIHFLEKDNFQGWEPYDIFNNYWTSLIKSRHLRAAITQIFRTTPIFLHPLLKEKKFYAKPVALFAHAFLILYEVSKDIQYRNRAIFFLNWLEQHRSSETQNFSLGAHYQVNLKTYGSSPDTPSPFITAMGIEAFISAYEILGDGHYLDLAASGIRFFLDELPQVQVNVNQSYFVYHPNNLKFVPNLPAVICGTLARFHSITGDKSILSTIEKNLRHVVQWQRDDGAWLYSPAAKYSDNFHTGFILEALAKYEHHMRDQQFNSSFTKGLAFYERTFFDETGRPHHKKLFGLPNNADSLLTQIDLGDCAQGIILFSLLLQYKRNLSETGFRLLNWCIERFRAKDGHFYYQQLPLYKSKSPFISLQAWMLYALAKISQALSAKPINDGSYV